MTLSAGFADTYIVGGQNAVDNSTLNYPGITATLYLEGFTASVDDGSAMSLYMVRGDVDGTSNETAFGYGAKTNTSAQTSSEGAERVGLFVLPSGTSAYRAQITCWCMEGVKEAKFYVGNDSGQAVDYTSTANSLKVVLITTEDDAA